MARNHKQTGLHTRDGIHSCECSIEAQELDERNDFVATYLADTFLKNTKLIKYLRYGYLL